MNKQVSEDMNELRNKIQSLIDEFTDKHDVVISFKTEYIYSAGYVLPTDCKVILNDLKIRGFLNDKP